MAIVEASRLRFIDLGAAPSQGSLAVEVGNGLSARPKTLPSRFFYDVRGSELFEQITELPEYYLTRREQALLERHAAEILGYVGRDLAIVEFGSGSSAKTRLLIETALAEQSTLDYAPIDISGEFLLQTANKLLDRYSNLRVTALAAEYRDAVEKIPQPAGPRLFLFLGSNLGNFTSDESVEFLGDIARIAKPQDRILLGLDLKKDRRILEAAYNDSQGVTAEFNKNILRRINVELGGEFDLDAFEHRAPYSTRYARIEMLLVSMAKQSVAVGALGKRFEFAKGETLHTEYSHKYTPRNFAPIARAAGLDVERRWNDDDGWFSLVLLRRSDP